MERASPTRALRRPPPPPPPMLLTLAPVAQLSGAPVDSDAALPPTPEQIDACATEIAHLLTAMATKLVCIDFDATFVCVHTGGTWSRSAAELKQYVRPLFLALVPLLVCRNIHVAVVTFSPQCHLIRDVLALCYSTDIAQQLILRCDEPSWQLVSSDTEAFAPLWQTGGRHLDRTCKLPFVISAALEAAHKCNDTVRNCDTLLFDDDAANIRVVADCGIAGVYFDAALQTDFAALLRQVQRFHASRLSTIAPAASPVQTPSKRQPTARMVRLMASPETRFFAPTSTARASSLRHRGQGTGGSATTRTTRFQLCTPSPITKLRSTVDMGRPRSKRSMRIMRKIENELHELHLPTPSPVATTETAPVAPMLQSTPATLLLHLDTTPEAHAQPLPTPSSRGL